MKLNLVPAKTGITWVKLGIRTFFRQPLALAALFFMYMSVASVAMLIPYLGIVIALLFEPAARLGLMVAAHEASSARFPMPTVLIAAFRAGRQRLNAILILGMLHAVACAAVLLIASLFAPEATKGAAAAPASPESQLGVMLPTLLMYMPVSMLFWHAPALVHFHGVSPVKSLFFSLVACLRNWAALLVFGLGWMAFILAVSVPLSLLAAMAPSQQAALPFIAPVLLAIAAMFSTSIYFTFRDSFTVDAPPAIDQPPGD
ncbi:MAG: hypothetical protein EOO28_28635, partial [Comamonadaceae bacterium]